MYSSSQCHVKGGDNVYHRGYRKIELEFMATAEEENLEDKLAYLS